MDFIPTIEEDAVVVVEDDLDSDTELLVSEIELADTRWAYLMMAVYVLLVHRTVCTLVSLCCASRPNLTCLSYVSTTIQAAVSKGGDVPSIFFYTKISSAYFSSGLDG